MVPRGTFDLAPRLNTDLRNNPSIRELLNSALVPTEIVAISLRIKLDQPSAYMDV